MSNLLYLDFWLLHLYFVVLFVFVSILISILTFNLMKKTSVNIKKLALG